MLNGLALPGTARGAVVAALVLAWTVLPTGRPAVLAGTIAATSQVGHVGFIYHGLQVQPPSQRTEQGRVLMPLFARYRLRTSTGQRASITFRDGTVLHLNQDTDAVLRSPHLTFVRSGEVNEIVQPGTAHGVVTAAAVAAAIGTDFLVQIINGSSYFMVARGEVLVSNPLGSTLVKPRQGALVVPGQAPQAAYPVDTGTATSWTQSLPAARLGENVALDANGGRVAGESSQRAPSAQGDLWNARFIDDGLLTTGWESGAGKVHNQWVELGFAGSRVYTISQVLIDPAATNGELPGADLRNFQIRVSQTGKPGSDFHTVLRGRCAQGAGLQRFRLRRPVQAKYVQLLAVDNYGSARGISVAELEVVTAP